MKTDLYPRSVKSLCLAVLFGLGVAYMAMPAQADAVPDQVKWAQQNVHISHIMAYANDNSVLMSFLEQQQQPVVAQVYGLYSNTPAQSYQVKINTLNVAVGQRWVYSPSDTHWTLFLKLAPIRTTHFSWGSQNFTQYTESVGFGGVIRQRFVDNWLGYLMLTGDYQIQQGDNKKLGDYTLENHNGWAKNVALQFGREIDFSYNNLTVTPMISYQASQNNWYNRHGVVSRLGPVVQANLQLGKGFDLGAELGYNQVFYPEAFRVKPDSDDGLSTYPEAFARLNLIMMLSARMRMTLHAGYTRDYGYGIDTYSLAVSQYFNW